MNDERLQIELFAEHPDIVTPTGIDVDKKGRVYIVESHTHKRPNDYKGPDTDHIKVFEDTDGNGRADRSRTFASGFHHTMDLKIHRNGWVYLAERDRVLRLRDTDGDGIADRRQDVVQMEGPGDYPHNGLSGLTVDFEGNLYFGLGENLGKPYTLIGTDGSELSGGGEGGSAYRCNPDGSGLVRLASGFWNPWGMHVDAFGRLFATDNDPDDAPPCRLLHVIPGGDYGYEYRYGRSGQHPFQAWNGELPGTLPMVAGTSEAPGGLISYDSDAFPDKYRGLLLVPSWADHRIESFQVSPAGRTVTASARIFVRGGNDFRPVALATAPDGSVYVSDWVKSQYRLHRHGRIWRLSPVDDTSRHRPDDPERAVLSEDRTTRENAARRLAGEKKGRKFLRSKLRGSGRKRVRIAALNALALKEDEKTNFLGIALDKNPVPLRVAAAENAIKLGANPKRFVSESLPPSVRVAALRNMRLPAHRSALMTSLRHDDPYLRTAAVRGLMDEGDRLLTLNVSSLPHPRQRLGVLLAMKRSKKEKANRYVDEFLEDPDPTVQFAAVKWVADRNLKTHQRKLNRMLDEQNLTIRLYRGLLSALEYLKGQKPGSSLSDERLYETLSNPETRTELRRVALRLIDPGFERLTVEKLEKLANGEEPALRLAAVRTLQRHPDDSRFQRLADITRDPSRPVTERAEAVVGLAENATFYRDLLLDLIRGDSEKLRIEALRALTGVSLTGQHETKLRNLVQSGSKKVRNAVARVLEEERESRPAREAIEAWLKRIAGTGNPSAGRRVFFHPKIGTCSKCHRHSGRGNRVGPDLTDIDRRMTRRKLLTSLLMPSKEIAPSYLPWQIKTKDGKNLIGFAMQKGGGREVYRDFNGERFVVKKRNIKSHRRLDTSIMPEDLPFNMTDEELRDLTSFLLQNN